MEEVHPRYVLVEEEVYGTVGDLGETAGRAAAAEVVIEHAVPTGGDLFEGRIAMVDRCVGESCDKTRGEFRARCHTIRLKDS